MHPSRRAADTARTYASSGVHDSRPSRGDHLMGHAITLRQRRGDFDVNTVRAAQGHDVEAATAFDGDRAQEQTRVLPARELQASRRDVRRDTPPCTPGASLTHSPPIRSGPERPGLGRPRIGRSLQVPLLAATREPSSSLLTPSNMVRCPSCHPSRLCTATACWFSSDRRRTTPGQPRTSIRRRRLRAVRNRCGELR